MISGRIGLAVGVSGLFAGHFFGFGIFLPFFPLVLESNGLSAAEIGLVLGVGNLARIAASPVMTNLSDRSGRRRLSVFVYSVLGSASVCLIFAGSGFWWAFVAVTGLLIFWAPIIPLADAYALDANRTMSLDYGRMRMWGSVAFVAANLAGGLLTGSSTIWMLTAGIAASCVVTGLIAMSLPSASGSQPQTDDESAKEKPPFGALWFWFAVFLFGLFQATHAAFYGFGTLYWQRLGIADLTIGIFWSLGVIAEVLLFIVAGRLLVRFDPVAFLIVAACASLVRWLLFPFADSVPEIAALQLLHGLSFGASHLGAVMFLGKVVPSKWAGTGQGMLATSVGIQLSAGLWICGLLYEIATAMPFFLMAGFSAAGLVMLLAVATVLRKKMALAGGQETTARNSL